MIRVPLKCLPVLKLKVLALTQFWPLPYQSVPVVDWQIWNTHYTVALSA